MAKGKRRSMHATTKYVDAPFFFKKTSKVTSCVDIKEAFVKALSHLYHHGLWPFKLILNIVIDLAVVQAK